jgi:hypothetical protein
MKHLLLERHILFGEPTYVGKNKKWSSPNRIIFSKESLERSFGFMILDDLLWITIAKIYRTLNKMKEF